MKFQCEMRTTFWTQESPNTCASHSVRLSNISREQHFCELCRKDFPNKSEGTTFKREGLLTGVELFLVQPINENDL